MIEIYSHYIVPFSGIVPLLIGLIYFKYLHKRHKLIFYFTLLSQFTDIICHVLIAYHLHDLFVLHIYTIAEFLLLSVYYIYEFANRPVLRKIIIITMAMFSIIWLLNPLYQDLSTFDSYASSLESIIISLMAIAYFVTENEKVDGTLWKNKPANWFNTGILLYFSGSMFLFLFTNKLMKAPLYIINILWGAHATLVLIMYALFSVGFITSKREYR